jgi:hypothetical protein
LNDVQNLHVPADGRGGASTPLPSSFSRGRVEVELPSRFRGFVGQFAASEVVIARVEVPFLLCLKNSAQNRDILQKKADITLQNRGKLNEEAAPRIKSAATAAATYAVTLGRRRSFGKTPNPGDTIFRAADTPPSFRIDYAKDSITANVH